jgi:nucleoside-diphosphate-sugar epimerase
VRVIVTGCAGFIGSNLCRMLLDEGHEVAGVDDLSAGTLENIPAGVEFHKLDIRARDIAEVFAGAGVVFHLAAKNCLLDCMQNPLETVDINVRGTVQVLEAVRAAGVPKIVYADTSAEYEGVTEFPSRVERVHPIGTYAVSKRAAWHFCDSYSRLYGLRLTTLRYFNVYGPAQDFRRVVPPVMSAFIMKMLAGVRPTIYGTGAKRRDFIYVDDVNRFHLLCVTDSRTDGGVFNVGSGVNYSIREIFDAIEAQLRTGLTPAYAADLPGEAEVTLAEVSEGLRFGWRPEIDLTEGLRRSIEYIKTRVLAAR